MVEQPERHDPHRDPAPPVRRGLLTVLSALCWTAIAVLVLVITYPGRFDDTVGKLSGVFGWIVALAVIVVQVARLIAVARGPHRR